MEKNRPGPRAVFRCLLIGALCSLMLMIAAPKLKIIYEMDGQRYRLEQEKVELEKKNRELESRLKEIDSSAAVEKIAREQLGMVKKGEKILIPVKEER
ncbi:MAG: septum formation initiator family protein [Syntrophomonas sp.]|uniref:FtsB family cell division protein n=1 Tax=Syntrophomonas sp. TaxID=2053627 RepID=UPI0026197AB9|nr:septum formation initiator family protein [Syntrophomonas sp.]MDD2510459.1 septum formation initiator family protein [Syntrophomonas sp.]MDD3880137.1 septum formation initiator family protein [Syntrophomonas sp.]MDD4627282.1 septum formation initiator family protein [Syntrophomonas sp.]